MLYVAVRTARQRIAGLLAVACAVLGGAALLTAIGVLAESGLRSHPPLGRLAGADVVVSASQTYQPDGDLPIALPERARIGAELVDRLRGLPRVTAAVGDVSLPAAVIDANGRATAVEAHGWSSTALLTGVAVAGAAPSSGHEVALDAATAALADVAPGGEIRIVAAGRAGTYHVCAVIRAAGPGLFFDDATALGLTGRDPASVDVIALRTEPGAARAVAARVREVVRGSGLVVSVGAARGDAGAPAAAAAQRTLPVLAASLASVTVLVIGCVVGGALAVSIGAQRRELALLRAVGATPRQLRRLAAGQATMVAAVAVVPGVAVGYLLAARFGRMLSAWGMIPADLPLRAGPLPALAAALLLLGAVWVAARCAVWRTSRMPATTAVAQSRTEPRTPSKLRLVIGLQLLIVAHALAVPPLLLRSPAAAAFTALAGLLAAIGLALAGPALLAHGSRALARRLPPRVSAPTWLAVANTRGYAVRAAAAVTTLAMTVVFTLTYALTQTTVLAAASGDVDAANRAQLRITAPALGGVPGDLLDAVRATPGVRAAAPVSTTTVLWPYRLAGDVEVDSGAALILTPDAPGVLDLDVRAGSVAGLSGDTIAVDAAVARSRGVGLGDRIELILGDGTRVRARVAATYARGLGLGPVVVSRDLAAGHTTSGLDQSLLVRTDGTVAARQSLAALAASRPGIVLDDEHPQRGGPAPELWINVAVLAVLLGYLLLGIANKLVASTTQRRDELALLRLVGATPSQTRAMMRREAALIWAAATFSGLLLSAVPLMLLAIGFLHRPWPAGPWWLVPAVALVVAAIAALSIELPTRRALRGTPLRGLARA
jgi:putative ABC transport system permease protein